MEHPVRDIRGVIKALCQGSPEEQREAINRHFLPSASFVHPFCRVPSFEHLKVPILGEINSRMLVLAIFKCPKIDLDIESVVFDQRSSLLYLTISQVFSIWFIPFHKAPVRLVTVLHLVPSQSHPTNGTGNGMNGTNSGAQTPNHHLLGTEDDEPSFAEVAAGSARPASPSSPTRQNNGGSRGGPTRYMIKQQEDHYQINEFAKFIFGTPASYVWSTWQLFSTVVCIVGVLLLGPVMAVLGPILVSGRGKGSITGGGGGVASSSRQKGA